jgi:hypothetical protein
MKQQFLILLVFLTLAACNNGNTGSADKINGDSLVTVKATDSLIFKIAIPQYDSLGKFTQIAIKIKKVSGKPTFLQFTAIGQTNIYVEENEVSDTHWGKSTPKITFGPDDAGLLDISSFKTGTYYINYSSFKVGGIYKLYLIE